MKKILTLIWITALLMGCTMMDSTKNADTNQEAKKSTSDPAVIDGGLPTSSTKNPDQPVSNVPSVPSVPSGIDHKTSSGSSAPHQGIVATYEPIPFQATIYRTNGYFEDAEYPVVMAIATKQELAEYLKQTRYDMERFEASMYDEAFFKENTLILIVLQENSGSITHEITDVYINDGVMTFDIHRNIPEIGTTDMAQYHVAIVISKQHMITSRFVVSLTK